MTASGEPGDCCTAPVLSTRFSSRRHMAYAQLCEYSRQSCARSLNELAATQAVSHHGAFAACGGSYAASIYPDRDVDRLKAVADLFLAGVFIDDLIDNTTDMSLVSELVAKYRAVVAGSPVGDARFDAVLRFYTDARWEGAALGILRAETNRYLDSTLALRAVEAERRSVSVDDFLEARATNVYLGVECCILAFAVPALAESLVRVSTAAASVLGRALVCSGTCVGLLADLYKVNGEHAELCEYTNLVRILQRQAVVPAGLPQAMARSVRLFHDFEDRLAAALEHVAALSPPLARAVEHVHAGTVVWMGSMRGVRYARRMPAAGPPQGHRLAAPHLAAALSMWVG